MKHRSKKTLRQEVTWPPGLYVAARRAARAAVLLCVLVASVAAQQFDPAYFNPVIDGDHPDPSVIRVGRGGFWATATSAEWAPIFPLFYSRDLVNWRQAGTVFSTRPQWAVGNFWAPEIAEDRGRYFVFYTARKKDGPLCVAVATAARPAGPYADRGPLVCQEDGSIDAVTVRDEAGRWHLVWKEDGNSRNRPTPLWAQMLSDDGTRLVGQKFELIRNDAPWEGNVVEAPYISRHGGWFYLFYSGNACCGRGCHYALGVARARRLSGPWEKNPANPILASNETWQCPGHGSIVTGSGGKTFLLYHAYHRRESIQVGRQVLLDEVRWDADGWPSINGGKGPSGGRAAALPGATRRQGRRDFFDSFTTRRLPEGWLWPHAQQPSMSIDRARGGWLVLGPGAGAGADDLAGGVAARLTTDADYVATTVLRLPADKTGVFAGLSAYGDRGHAWGVAAGAGEVILWQRERGEQRVLARTKVPRSRLLYLRMVASEGRPVRFAVGTDGRSWTEVGSATPSWDFNVNVALTVGGAAGASAEFGWLRIKSLSPDAGQGR